MTSQLLLKSNPDEWPEMVKEIAEVIGKESAIKLFIRFAGRHLCIPQKIPEGHIIEKTIGAERAELLRSHFRNDRLLFPTGASLIRKVRNKEIYEDHVSGVSIGDLSTKYRLTTRQISTILSNYKTNTPNGGVLNATYKR